MNIHERRRIDEVPLGFQLIDTDSIADVSLVHFALDALPAVTP